MLLSWLVLSGKHESLVNNFLTSQTCWTSWIWWTSVLHVWYLTMRNSNIGNIIQVRIVSICFSFKFYKSKQLGKGTWYIYYHFSCLKNSSCQLSATSAKNFMNVKIMLLRKQIFTHFLMNKSLPSPRDQGLCLWPVTAPVGSTQQH